MFNAKIFKIVDFLSVLNTLLSANYNKPSYTKTSPPRVLISLFNFGFVLNAVLQCQLQGLIFRKILVMYTSLPRNVLPTNSHVPNHYRYLQKK